MKRALLVIDVQNEYFTGHMPVTYPEGSLENILSAIDSANQSHIPVILIRHSSTSFLSPVFRKESKMWQIHPDVLSRPYNALVDKTFPGSFTGTNLQAILEEAKADTVVVCGYMTQMCCDTTARQAFHLGYKVEFLSDATGTLDFSNEAGKVTAEELHRAILVTQAAKFSKVLKTKDWIKSL